MPAGATCDLNFEHAHNDFRPLTLGKTFESAAGKKGDDAGTSLRIKFREEFRQEFRQECLSLQHHETVKMNSAYGDSIEVCYFISCSISLMNTC